MQDIQALAEQRILSKGLQGQLSTRTLSLRNKVGDHAKISSNFFQDQYQQNNIDYHDMPTVAPKRMNSSPQQSFIFKEILKNQPEAGDENGMPITCKKTKGRGVHVMKTRSRKKDVFDTGEDQCEEKSADMPLEIPKHEHSNVVSQCQISYLTKDIGIQQNLKTPAIQSVEIPQQSKQAEIPATVISAYKFEDEEQPQLKQSETQACGIPQQTHRIVRKITKQQQRDEMESEDLSEENQNSEIRVNESKVYLETSSPDKKQNPKFIVADFGEVEEPQADQPGNKNKNNVNPVTENMFEIIQLLHQIPQNTNVREFMLRPVPKGYVIQCTIKRDANLLSSPQYHLYLSHSFRHLASARKSSSATSSSYLMSTQKNNFQKTGNFYLGKIESNFFGTKCHAFGPGLSAAKAQTDQERRGCIMSIEYETSYFGLNGPRKMTVAIPQMDQQTEKAAKIQSEEGLLEHPRTQRFVNKPPRFDPYLKSYVLNFNGRANLSSIKNFLMVPESDQNRVQMLFGRVAKNVFNLDVQYPFSPLQAFSIAVSSFLKKIGQ